MAGGRSMGQITPGVVLSKVAVYAVGHLFMAFGVAFSVNSGLGVSPVNSLPYVVSLVLGVDMGSCVIGVFSFYVLVQILIYRRDFKWINLTQIVFSTLFGYFVDFAKAVVGDFALPTYPGQLIMLAVSMVLVALGVCLYMDAGLVNMPMEGMTNAIAERIVKKPFHDVKVAVDCLAVAAAILLSFVGLGGLEGIREGTLLCALLVGKMMKPMQKVVAPLVARLCSALQEEQEETGVWMEGEGVSE